MACVGGGEVHSQRPLPSETVQQENVAKGDNEVLKQLALDMQSILTKVRNNKGLLNQLAKKQPASRPSQAEIHAARAYATRCFIVGLLILLPLAFSIVEVIGKEEDYWRIYGPISTGLLIHAVLVSYISRWVDWDKAQFLIYGLAYGTTCLIFVPLIVLGPMKFVKENQAP